MSSLDHPERPSNSSDLTTGFNNSWYKALTEVSVKFNLSLKMGKLERLGHQDEGLSICQCLSNFTKPHRPPGGACQNTSSNLADQE